MFFTIWIYIYSALLVIGSLFKLNKAKKLYLKSNLNMGVAETIFSTPKIVSQKVIKRTGTKVMVKGQEKLPDEAVLFVANHQGLFDILLLLGHLGKPVGFIAKKEIKKIPIINSWMELIHCIFIDRSDRRQSIRAINQGIGYLQEGHSLVIFPEGTRSRGRNLNEFKPGSLRLATKANVPIVPVAIDGTYHMYEEGNNRVKASSISLTIEEPIYPEQYKDKNSKELAKQLQMAIEKSLHNQ